MMASTSYTQPPQVPPPTFCSAAPQPRVVRQLRLGRQVGARRPLPQHLFSALRPELHAPLPDEVEAAAQAAGVDLDADQVPVPQLAERSAAEGLGSYVAGAGPGREPGENARRSAPPPGFRNRGTSGAVVTCAISSMPVPRGPQLRQHHYVPGLYPLRLEGGDRGALGGEDLRRTGVPGRNPRRRARPGRSPCSSPPTPAARGCRAGSRRCWSDPWRGPLRAT